MRAIQLEPYSATTYSNLGLLLEEVQNYSEALQAYDHAIQIEPYKAIHHYNKSVLLERIKAVEEGKRG
jgi:tetratricopeptide (TPR) repeat protein